MIFLKKENKIAIVACIEMALMRGGNVNYNLVRSRLKNLYNCEFSDCIDHLEYLRTVLKEVYGQDYDSILQNITWEFETLDMDEFKTEFCEIMSS